MLTVSLMSSDLNFGKFSAIIAPSVASFYSLLTSFRCILNLLILSANSHNLLYIFHLFSLWTAFVPISSNLSSILHILFLMLVHSLTCALVFHLNNWILIFRNPSELCGFVLVFFFFLRQSVFLFLMSRFYAFFHLYCS